MVNTKEEVNISKMYSKECLLSKEEFIKEFDVNKNGLSSEIASDRLHMYGFNEITRYKT